MRLAELGRSVEAAIGRREPAVNPALERLENQLTTLGEELKVALANRNAAVASQETVDRLEQRLDALSKNIVATLAERSEPSILGRLDEIAARIDDLLDRAPAVSSIATLHARLQSLVESVEGLSASQHEPAAALDEIKSEIAAIRRDIAARGAPDTGQLEHQIRELAARIETVTSADSEGGAGMAELEAQVARLASQLDDDSPRAAVLRHVEESLETLQSRLSDSHRESIEAARAEARAAVNELSASLDGRGIDSDLIRALRQDLDNLRAATEDHSRQDDARPEAVDQTLTQVVDRLDQLERATEVEPRATGTHGTGGTAPAVSPPQKATTGDRRADFIAAARRAAQAAAAEAHRVEAPPAERIRRGDGPQGGRLLAHQPGDPQPQAPAAAGRRGDHSGHRRRQALRHGGQRPRGRPDDPRAGGKHRCAAIGDRRRAGRGRRRSRRRRQQAGDGGAFGDTGREHRLLPAGSRRQQLRRRHERTGGLRFHPRRRQRTGTRGRHRALPASQTAGDAPDAAIGSPKLVKAAASGDAPPPSRWPPATPPATMSPRI